MPTAYLRTWHLILDMIAKLIARFVSETTKVW